MKLINAGLGRTGTTSLKAALEQLGYNSIHHTTDLFFSPKQMDIWEGAFEGQNVNWRAFYEKYDVADWPAGLFYKEIITAHPEAKVMITVRDPEQWFESINGTLTQLNSIKLPIPHVRRIKRFLETYAINGLFQGKMDDKEFMVQFYENYVASVKEFVTDKQLLVFNVREGWEPLCTFLEMEVPDEPFPRANTRGGFKELITTLLQNMKG